MGKYLIDVNLPRYLSLWSGEQFVFVVDLNATWKDWQIWNYAAAHRLTIVTKDADFSDRVLVSKEGPRVIHMRVGNMKLGEFHEFLNKNWERICHLSQDYKLVHVYQDSVECLS